MSVGYQESALLLELFKRAESHHDAHALALEVIYGREGHVLTEAGHTGHAQGCLLLVEPARTHTTRGSTVYNT